MSKATLNKNKLTKYMKGCNQSGKDRILLKFSAVETRRRIVERRLK
jgi:hypothetical protein